MPDELAADLPLPAPRVAPVPVCPYCGQDPCLPDLVEMMSGRFITKISMCDNPACRKVFGVQIIGERAPQIMTPSQLRPPRRMS
jgi:hypothetical protein